MASQTPTVPLTAPPRANQLVEHDGRTYTTVREGLAYILIPPDARTSQDPQAKAKAAVGGLSQQPQNVFYNPIQQFNRDLSVLAIKAFGEDLCERRRSKWEKGREKQAEKKGRKKEKKRKRDEYEGVKAAKIEAEVEERVSNVKDGGAEVSTTDSFKTAGVDENVPSALGKDQADAGGLDAGRAALNGTHTQEDVDAAAPEVANDTPELQPERQQRFRILDALSATGLRALRYAKEIPFATHITANDMDRKAVQSIEVHVRHNDLSSKILPTTSNALAHMYGVAFPPHSSHGPDHVSAKYDVIDLDPYGTAAPFIDAALQALTDGGLLCVTCTDSGVFASCGYTEKTFSLYGGLPIKGSHSHEGGLRLILQSVAATAAKYGIAVEPLLCLSIDFYARLFIRIRRSPADVKFLAGKTMLVYGCDAGCGAWTTQMLGRNTKQADRDERLSWKHSAAQAPSADRLCEHCGSKTHVAGPMWAGPLHHPAFLEKILDDVTKVDKDVYGTTARIQGMLDTALAEMSEMEYAAEPAFPHPSIPKLAPHLLDRMPFFVLPSALAKVVHCQAPPEAAVKGALRHAGYKATRSHCRPGSLKTDAPWSAIWEVMRQWVKQKAPINEDKIKPGSVGWRILQLSKKQGQAAEQEPEQVDRREKNAEDGIVREADKPEEDGEVEQGDQAEATATERKREPGRVEVSEQKATDVRKIKVVFDEALGRGKPGKKLVRYQSNPRENWGPMSRAK